MAKFKHHIFICQNTREAGNPRGCCNPDGKSPFIKLFKEALRAKGLEGVVRANKAGCLDHCEHGPMVVIYPDELWYGRVDESDIQPIVDGLASGNPLERLLLKEDCINTSSCEHKAAKT